MYSSVLAGIATIKGPLHGGAGEAVMRDLQEIGSVDNVEPFTMRALAANGTPELVLVSGYSGIGKSSVVQELHRVLVPPRGLFASGKFDQYKRDIPYATLAQAFQGLIRPLLGKDDAELGRWRDALRQALGPNGLLMVGLVPELKPIIGEPPPECVHAAIATMMPIVPAMRTEMDDRDDVMISDSA